MLVSRGPILRGTQKAMASNTTHLRLGVISLGLAFGIAWAVTVLALAVAAGLFGWGTPAALVIQSVYFGFAPTFPGAIAGAVWGFAHGFIFGSLIGWLYNRLLLTRQFHVSGPHHE